MDDSDTEEDPSLPLLPATPLPEEHDAEDPFEYLARITPSIDSIPWEQRTTKMKIIQVADRIFLCFIALFFLVLVGEVTYTLYHIVPWTCILRAIKDRLLMQEEGEEDYEL